MLDFDLAEIYEVETRVLNQAVKRNIARFPKDFMFQLSQNEWDNMLSQIVMTYPSKRPKSATPLAFTEHGVTMLASVLRSEKAVKISIQIVRVFVAMRTYFAELATTSREIAELWRHIKNLELQSEENLKDLNDMSEENQVAFDEIYLALSELAVKQKKSEMDSNTPRRAIGFLKPNDNK